MQSKRATRATGSIDQAILDFIQYKKLSDSYKIGPSVLRSYAEMRGGYRAISSTSVFKVSCLSSVKTSDRHGHDLAVCRQDE